MGDFHFSRRQGIDIHAEPVILGGDHDPAALDILDRVVSPVVAELELVGLAPEGEPENLLTQADPKNRKLSQELLYCLGHVGDALRVTRTVGKQNPVRFPFQDFFRGRPGGQYENPAPMLLQAS